MDYKISKSRAKELMNAFFEFSFEDKKPDKKLFKAIKNPAELHFIAEIYNWDDGTEVLNWIIKSPLCDLGTAKLIFWRAQPDSYTIYKNKKEADWDGDVFTLLKTIIKNVEGRFYKSENIAYNPRKDAGAPSDINFKNEEDKWSVPEVMKKPTKGKKVTYPRLD